MHLLAVTGARRDPRLPQVPTAVEAALKDFVFVRWVGLLAPPAVPAPSVARLNAARDEALATPVLRQRLAETGLSAEGGEAAHMQRQIHEDVRLHRGIAERAKLKFE